MKLRPARNDDAERLLAWRNDPETRRFAFTPGVIAWDDHVAWFERRLADPDSAMLVAEEDGRAIGQVRLDRQGEDVAVVAVVIAPDARGRGAGSRLLAAAASACPLPVRVLRAEVVPANEASLRAFTRAGFEEVGRDERAVTLERAVG